MRTDASDERSELTISEKRWSGNFAVSLAFDQSVPKGPLSPYRFNCLMSLRKKGSGFLANVLEVLENRDFTSYLSLVYDARFNPLSSCAHPPEWRKSGSTMSFPELTSSCSPRRSLGLYDIPFFQPALPDVPCSTSFFCGVTFRDKSVSALSRSALNLFCSPRDTPATYETHNDATNLNEVPNSCTRKGSPVNQSEIKGWDLKNGGDTEKNLEEIGEEEALEGNEEELGSANDVFVNIRTCLAAFLGHGKIHEQGREGPQPGRHARDSVDLGRIKRRYRYLGAKELYDAEGEIIDLENDIILGSADWSDETSPVQVFTMYKPVAKKVKPVPGVYPEESKVRRTIPEDPLLTLPTLNKQPADFRPSKRISHDRLKVLNINPDNFLSREEEKLFTQVMINNEEVFAFDESERGTFREDYFSPYIIPVVPHEVWQHTNIPIPPGIREQVIEMLRDKIKAGVYEPSQSSYRSRWFCVMKKNGKLPTVAIKLSLCFLVRFSKTRL